MLRRNVTIGLSLGAVVAGAIAPAPAGAETPASRVPGSAHAPSDAAVLGFSHNGSARRVTLTRSGAAGLRVGDFLALGVGKATPLGYLGRVTALSRGHGTVVAATAPATLSQAIPAGALAASRHIAVSAARSLTPQSLVRATALGPCGGAAGLGDYDLSAKVVATVRLSARWQRAERGARLTHALFAVHGSQHVVVGSTLSAPPGCAYRAALGDPVRLPPVTVRVRGLPVVLTPKLRFTLRATSTGSVAAAYGVSQAITMTGGAAYTGGAFRPLTRLASSAVAQPVSAGARSTSATTLGLTMTLLVDGVPGASLALTAGGVLSANPKAPPPAPWWTLRATISGSAILPLDRWLLPLRWSRARLLGSSKLVASAVAPPAAPALSAAPIVTDLEGHPPVVGDSLRSDQGTWANAPSQITYQWQRCPTLEACSDIPGATAERYALTAGDAARLIRVGVTARNAVGAARAYSAPTAFVRLDGVVAQIAGGYATTCARRATHDVYCFGSGQYGGLGNGTTTSMSTIVPVTGLGDATSIDGGTLVECALRTGGTVVCWGHTITGGGLGDGRTTSSSVPLGVTGISDATAVSVGEDIACALRAGGDVACWGDNRNAALGDGTVVDAAIPVAVSGLHDATAVSAGPDHACALRAGHSVVCWGLNWHGMLGNGGSEAGSATPVLVSGLSDATAIDADGYGSCALRAGGSVLCWGIGQDGALGNGTMTDAPAPVPVTGLTDAIAIGKNLFSACALRAGGSVACWGDNERGQLGNASKLDSTVPVAVSGLTDAVAIGLSGYRACALRKDNSVVCWGDDVGDASHPPPQIESTTPVEVPGL